MGTILDLARRDSAFIINAGGFETDITFTVGGNPVIVKGIATKHHIGYDDDGERVNTKNAQITVNESDLLAIGITTRGASGEVNITSNIISYADSTGNTSSYVITENYPNETFGHIVCMLGDYQV